MPKIICHPDVTRDHAGAGDIVRAGKNFAARLAPAPPSLEPGWDGTFREDREDIKLVNLAVERITDAERCAAAGCFTAACAMAGAGVEAPLMAHVCCSTDDVRAAGRWRDCKAAPLYWSFEQLIRVAVALAWLPASQASIPDDEAVDKLLGEIGDAIRFVQYARNLVVHLGKYVRHTPWLPVLGESERRRLAG